VKPEDLTEEAIVEAMCDKEPGFYQDFNDFSQDCHSVSLALVRSGLLGEGGPSLRVARGACIGVGGQHSWVVLGNPYDQTATIVDITLWSYDSSAPRIWIGNQINERHRPKGGETLWQTMRPCHSGDEIMALGTDDMSREARDFLDILGPLDARGWAALWSRCGMMGWPAREILEAFLDQFRDMAALVPIDIVGMVTDRNPQELYW